jgi:hypothetical protein
MQLRIVKVTAELMLLSSCHKLEQTETHTAEL